MHKSNEAEGRSQSVLSSQRIQFRLAGGGERARRNNKEYRAGGDGHDDEHQPVRRSRVSGEFHVQDRLKPPENKCEQHGHNPPKGEACDHGYQKCHHRLLHDLVSRNWRHLPPSTPRPATRTWKLSPMPAGVTRCLSWSATLARSCGGRQSSNASANWFASPIRIRNWDWVRRF